MDGACSADGGEERRIQGTGGKTEGKDHLLNPWVDERIILNWIFRRWVIGIRTGLRWLRIGTGGGHL
jgi:hypothetical protein